MDFTSQDALIAALAMSTAIVIYQSRKLAKEKATKKSIIEQRNKLESDILMLRAEHLKFRLQPHTLNNILANLKAIANKLNRGMDGLSGTLDYILYHGDTHYVSVESELEFIKRYLDLNDLFLDEIDPVSLDDSQVNRKSSFFQKECIPHLVTAYFLENAFKHGDISHPEFLKIKIKLTNNLFEMHVVNRIQTFSMRSRSGGIGQKNMMKRLELLLPEKHDVRFSCNETEYHSLLKIDLL